MKQIFYLACVFTLALTFPVFAHHPLGGITPDSILHGFLSGIGHPIIGFDHLVFVIAVGFISAMQRYRLVMPAGFVLGTILGTVLSVSMFTLPLAEWVITFSVIFAGIVAMLGYRTTILPATILVSVAGIFHGWAYGEAVIGAETHPLVAYLFGFSVIQILIMLASGQLIRSVWKVSSVDALNPRLAGAMIAGVGFSYFVELAETIIFPAM